MVELIINQHVHASEQGLVPLLLSWPIADLGALGPLGVAPVVRCRKSAFIAGPIHARWADN